MDKNYTRRILIVVAVLATLVVNALATSLPLNNLTTGEISDRFAIYFVPAGYVFSIWGLIYLGLIAFAIWQLLPKQVENQRLQRAAAFVLLSCAANIAWLFFWHYELFALTVPVMLVLLLSLIAIYLRLEIGRADVSATEKWFAHIPFSVYLGWITVATVANVTQLLYYLGWRGWGISPEAWAVIMLVAATGITAGVGFTRGDVAYMLVIIWAFVGIALKHAAVPSVATAAWVMTGVVAVVLVAGAALHARRKRAVGA